jgi:hypothetical protein
MRDSLGLDPFDNPAADRPMVLTATGVPIFELRPGHRAVWKAKIQRRFNWLG